jgi:anaerobic selenocysteine-containing dehydrogenase
MHGWEANLSPERLTLPLLRKEDSLQPASWDEAMSLIVSRSKEIRDAFTASAIGFYTSGQLFLEEYYTLALIGQGGLGTPHMDGNTRLCTATAGESLKQHLAPRVGTNVALLNGLLHLLIAAGSIDRAFRWRSYWAGTSLLHCSW